MKYVPMWVARLIDGNLCLRDKIRFVFLWSWVSSPVSTLKYEWQMYKDRKKEKRVRKFLLEQGLEIEDYL